MLKINPQFKILFSTCFLFVSFFFIQCKGQTNATLEEKNTMEEVISVPSVSIASLDSLKVAHPNFVLMDVRTPSETALGKLDGAIEIDFKAPDFNAKLETLDKDQTYLIYCRSGRRSLITTKTMNEMGFENVIDLAGGYKHWLSLKTEN